MFLQLSIISTQSMAKFDRWMALNDESWAKLKLEVKILDQLIIWKFWLKNGQKITHSVSIREICQVNHLASAQMIRHFDWKIVNEWTWSKKYDNKSLKKQNLNVYIDDDFKKQTEIENDNLPLLAVEGFFNVPWMKHKRPTVLFDLT